MPESGVVPLMNAETEVAIVFADVVGSTRLYELLGRSPGTRHDRDLR